MTTEHYDSLQIFSLAWAKSAGGPDGEYAKGVAVLSDDSVVVTGSFNSTAVFGGGEMNETSLTSVDGSDVYVARYAADGTLVWAKRAGGTNHDQATGVAVLSDSSLMLTGDFSRSLTFGPGEPNEISFTCDGLGTDVFVARYNADGSFAWAKRTEGASSEWARGVAALSDDSVAVIGSFYDTTTFGPGETNETTLTPAGNWDIFVARFYP